MFGKKKARIAELAAEVGRLTSELDSAEAELAVAQEERAVAIESWNKRVERFKSWKANAQAYTLAKRLSALVEQQLFPVTDPSRPVFDVQKEWNSIRAELEAAAPPEVVEQ